MKNIVKLAIGVAAVTAGTIVAGHLIKKHQEKKYVTPGKHETVKESHETDTTKKAEEDISLKERLATAATEKVMDILSWANDHEKELKGLAIMFTVAGGAVDLALGLKKVGKRCKLFEEIDNISKNVWIDGYNAALDECFEGLTKSAKKDIPFGMTITKAGRDVMLGEWIVKEAREVAA